MKKFSKTLAVLFILLIVNSDFLKVVESKKFHKMTIKHKHNMYKSNKVKTKPSQGGLGRLIRSPGLIKGLFTTRDDHKIEDSQMLTRPIDISEFKSSPIIQNYVKNFCERVLTSHETTLLDLLKPTAMIAGHNSDVSQHSFSTAYDMLSGPIKASDFFGAKIENPNRHQMCNYILAYNPDETIENILETTNKPKNLIEIMKTKMKESLESKIPNSKTSIFQKFTSNIKKFWKSKTLNFVKGVAFFFIEIFAAFKWERHPKLYEWANYILKVESVSYACYDGVMTFWKMMTSKESQDEKAKRDAQYKKYHEDLIRTIGVNLFGRRSFEFTARQKENINSEICKELKQKYTEFPHMQAWIDIQIYQLEESFRNSPNYIIDCEDEDNIFLYEACSIFGNAVNWGNLNEEEKKISSMKIFKTVIAEYNYILKQIQLKGDKVWNEVSFDGIVFLVNRCKSKLKELFDVFKEQDCDTLDAPKSKNIFTKFLVALKNISIALNRGFAFITDCIIPGREILSDAKNFIKEKYDTHLSPKLKAIYKKLTHVSITTRMKKQVERTYNKINHFYHKAEEKVKVLKSNADLYTNKIFEYASIKTDQTLNKIKLFGKDISAWDANSISNKALELVNSLKVQDVVKYGIEFSNPILQKSKVLLENKVKTFEKTLQDINVVDNMIDSYDIPDPESDSNPFMDSLVESSFENLTEKLISINQTIEEKESDGSMIGDYSMIKYHSPQIDATVQHSMEKLIYNLNAAKTKASAINKSAKKNFNESFETAKNFGGKLIKNAYNDYIEAKKISKQMLLNAKEELKNTKNKIIADLTKPIDISNISAESLYNDDQLNGLNQSIEGAAALREALTKKYYDYKARVENKIIKINDLIVEFEVDGQILDFDSAQVIILKKYGKNISRQEVVNLLNVMRYDIKEAISNVVKNELEEMQKHPIKYMMGTLKTFYELKNSPNPAIAAGRLVLKFTKKVGVELVKIESKKIGDHLKKLDPNKHNKFFVGILSSLNKHVSADVIKILQEPKSFLAAKLLMEKGMYHYAKKVSVPVITESLKEKIKNTKGFMKLKSLDTFKLIPGVDKFFNTLTTDAEKKIAEIINSDDPKDQIKKFKSLLLSNAGSYLKEHALKSFKEGVTDLAKSKIDKIYKDSIENPKDIPFVQSMVKFFVENIDLIVTSKYPLEEFKKIIKDSMINYIQESGKSKLSKEISYNMKEIGVTIANLDFIQHISNGPKLVYNFVDACASVTNKIILSLDIKDLLISDYDKLEKFPQEKIDKAKESMKAELNKIAEQAIENIKKNIIEFSQLNDEDKNKLITEFIQEIYKNTMIVNNLVEKYIHKDTYLPDIDIHPDFFSNIPAEEAQTPITKDQQRQVNEMMNYLLEAQSIGYVQENLALHFNLKIEQESNWKLAEEITINMVQFGANYFKDDIKTYIKNLVIKGVKFAAKKLGLGKVILAIKIAVALKKVYELYVLCQEAYIIHVSQKDGDFDYYIEFRKIGQVVGKFIELGKFIFYDSQIEDIVIENFIGAVQDIAFGIVKNLRLVIDGTKELVSKVNYRIKTAYNSIMSWVRGNKRRRRKFYR
jgi:hypothetical protein